MTRARSKSTNVQAAATSARKALLGEIPQFILAARQRVARLVDSGITLVYWQNGERVRRDILGHDRADPLRHAIRCVEDFANEAFSHTT